ncbi:TIGR00730 family Rossman fold protein [Candidatus Uhrbacteria bacterium]|nr:TIGR00730 family Rossman fold protein [Candidatus Uhrbacteria bacterium]
MSQKSSVTKRRNRSLNIPASELPSQTEDFRTTEAWRVLRIQAEFVDGFNFLADLQKTVTFFGSARLKENDPWYQEARKLGGMLADAGYNVVTGGGPGIMEAANRGACEGGGDGDSIGLNIKLPREQRTNPFVEKSVGFHYFFVRKVMLAFSAQAYVYFPGGFGTMDELAEIVTLIQTKKMSNRIPVILVGRDFWQPFLDWVSKTMVGKYRTLTAKETGIINLVDSAEEALKLIRKAPIRTKFG